jgi:hypothetical protein
MAEGADVSDGCPGHTYAFVETLVMEETPFLLARARVVAADGRVSEFLQVTDGRLEFGWGSCALARLQPGKYQVTLSALDLAGNEVPAPGKPIAIEVPRWDSTPAAARSSRSRPTDLRSLAVLSGDAGWPEILRNLALFGALPFGVGFAAVAMWMGRRRGA